jgi:hypothetical protein
MAATLTQSIDRPYPTIRPRIARRPVGPSRHLTPLAAVVLVAAWLIVLIPALVHVPVTAGVPGPLSPPVVPSAHTLSQRDVTVVEVAPQPEPGPHPGN